MADLFNFESAYKLFADQFEPDGVDFLYRRNSKSEAFRVSAAERDAFVADYKRRYRWLFWSIMVAVWALILGWTFAAIREEESPNVGIIVAGLLVLMVPLAAGIMWMFGAPARELKGRTPAAPALSPQEARDLYFSKLSYGQLAVGIVVMPVLLLRFWERPGSFDGWGLVWPVLGGSVTLLAAVQAVRKYLHERR